ncbi:MAG: hypothetical protein V1685_06025, partial [Parcubacteria group bacterium]
LAASVLAAAFFVGVALFRFRLHRPFGFLGAPNGFEAFIGNMPWIPIILALAGITFGTWIMRKYDFSYRHAFIGIAGGFVFSLLVFGIVIDAVGLPERAGELTPIRPFIEQSFSNDTWLIGVASDVSNDRFNLAVPRGDVIRVYFRNDTVIEPPMPLQDLEWVRVVGEWKDEAFDADVLFHELPPRGTGHIIQFQIPIER